MPQKLGYKKFNYTKKFYVHEIATANLSKMYFLKKAMKTCKQPINRDLNRNWIEKKHLDYIKKMITVR